MIELRTPTEIEQMRPAGRFVAEVLGALEDAADVGVNLLDLDTKWEPTSPSADTFKSSDGKWTGSRVDLVFGSNSELRALAEVYASDDAREKFVHDFVAAWAKVMDADRFDVK